MKVTSTDTTGMTPFVPAADNTRQLRDAFGRFATGVTIVTTATENGPAAITVNSFSSLSLDPPLVLWALDKSSNRYAHFTQDQHFAIHVLAANQEELCWRVAREGAEVLASDLTTNTEGVPVLTDCLARFECSRYASYDGGDHDIIVGQVMRVAMREDGHALMFFKGKMTASVAD